MGGMGSNGAKNEVGRGEWDPMRGTRVRNGVGEGGYRTPPPLEGPINLFFIQILSLKTFLTFTFHEHFQNILTIIIWIQNEAPIASQT